MNRFYKQTCPVCNKEFTENEDIVVCPECGTPYHRECYAKNGGCVNRSKHAEGFEWKPVIIEGVNDKPYNTVKCPSCGADCAEDARFCENCGAPLKPIRRTGDADFLRQKEEMRQRVQAELNSDLDGFKVGDWATYIRTNAQYYIFKFKKMEADPKYKPFNFTAFFFAPVWFVYRRMYKYGILAAIINMVMNIPAMIIYASSLGQLPVNSPLMFSGINDVAFYMSLGEILINLVWGFLAIPLYKKHIKAKLEQVKAKTSSPNEFYRELTKKSGPSPLGILLCILVAFSYFIQLMAM